MLSNGLLLGYGADGPEDYTRVLYETTADAAIGWRAESKKIVLFWLDNVPHDCNYRLDCGGSGSTGPDPGRDAIVGTADDLDLATVLQDMADNNITLIALHSGGSLSLWDCYASKTGGKAVQINYDGTIPGGEDIATFVAGLIQEEIAHIDELTLEVCDPAYEDWLVSVIPSAYTDIDLDEPQDFEFDIEICVPEGTEGGTYCFNICAVGDGVVYARQRVCIKVPKEVAVDIKPTSCPNPLNIKDKGTIPVAVLGTEDFDVTQIDPSTVMLEGVPPLRWSLEDVATPYEPFVGKEDCEDCTTEGPDGYQDLGLKFDAQELVAVLGTVEDGKCLVLRLTGKLKEEFSGTDIIGEDVVWIKAKGK